jgi:hypothetical protein
MRVQGMGHRLDAPGIDGLELVDQAEYLVQSLRDAARVLRGDVDAGKAGDALQLVGGQGHAGSMNKWARISPGSMLAALARRLPEVAVRVS